MNFGLKVLVFLWVFILRIFGWFYRLILLNLISIPFIVFHFIKMIVTGKTIKVFKEWRRLRKITTTSQIKLEYAKFKYKYEGFYEHDEKSLDKRPIFAMWPTWVCPIIIFLARDKKANCDDAAYFSRKLYRYMLKNTKQYKYKVRVRVRVRVYMPYTFPDCFLRIHYITEVTNKITGGVEILSNGKITYESKDNLAERYLRHRHYFWFTDFIRFRY